MHVKSNYIMGNAATLLGLGGLYFRNYYEQAYLYNRLLEILTVPLNYFIKCYINPKEIYVHCGEPGSNKSAYVRPEMSTFNRKCFKVTDIAPGSDAVATMASALAVGSILFKDKDPVYSN